MSASLSFLGILNKGGQLLFGAAARGGESKKRFVILADDCSGNTKSEFACCNLIHGYTKEELGRALGYDELSAVVIKNTKAALSFIEKAKKEGRNV